MAQVLNFKIRGLYTHANELSEVPEGALSVADNVVITKESIVEPRRGLDRLSYALGVLDANRANKLFSYRDRLLCHYSTGTLAYYDDSIGWTSYSGTFAAPDSDNKVRSAQSNSNFYFTTDEGVMKLDAYNASVVSSGMVKGLDITAALSGASGFMSTNTQVAYRVIWGYRDLNNNLIVGSPSQREVIANSSGGTRDVSLTITIPDGVSTTDLFQVYRSNMSASSSDVPDDNLYLVYEANPTSGEITAKSLTFVDSQPDSLKGAELYINSTQETILQANETPPLAKDIAAFKNCMFYGNTISKHRLSLTLLAVGGTSGVAINDVITIAGTTYTGKAAESVASREFKVVTGGTPAQNIADTALSIVRVINQNSTNTAVYAYYLSGPDDLPGQILLEERGLGGSSFAVVASAHGTAYKPALPTSGTTVSSSNDEYKNGIYFSKTQQPEAVPLTNFLRAGSADKKILRILASRDSLFVFKEDGIYRILGESPTSFRVEPFDTNTRLIAPETAVTLNNQIFALTDQGVVSVTDTGVSVVSRPIEKTILDLLSADTIDAIKTKAFAVPYETERSYILCYISNSGDTYSTQQFVYNTFTSAWTRWTLNVTCGLVNPADNLLYMGDALTNKVAVERKSLTFRDYVDEAVTGYSVLSSSGKSVVLNSINGIEVGDLLYQSSTVSSVVLAIDSITATVTVATTASWSAASATIYKAFESVVEWVPNAAGNPGVMKQFAEATFLLRNNFFSTARVGFYSELSSSVDEVDVSGSFGLGWGLFGWGNQAWGGVQKTKPIRTYVPANKQFCDLLSVRFSHRGGYGRFAVQGLSLIINGSMSERVTR